MTSSARRLFFGVDLFGLAYLKMKRRDVSPILPLLVVVGAYRLTLLGRGAMAFPDETWYYQSALILQQLRTGQLSGLLAHIAFNWGRPGDAILKLIPAALQGIPFLFGVPPSNPSSLIIPAACNAIVSLITLYLFFRVCLVLFDGDRTVSTMAAVVYGLLVNSNVYVRHMLACDWALCIGAYALWLTLSRQPTMALAFRVGMLAGSVITVYPGYYLFAAIPGVAFVAPYVSPGSTQRWRIAAGFTFGVVVVIATIDILCRIGGLSYFSMAQQLSGTVTQGSFEEGWVFLPRYLIQVERYAGGMLLIGFAVYFARTVWKAVKGTWRKIDWLILAAAIAWMWQAVAAYHWHAMVLYGRLIHPWMVFLVLALADAITWAQRDWSRNALCAAAVAVALISWGPSAYDYYGLAYPVDVLYKIGIDTTLLPASRMRCEMQSVYSYTSPPPLNRETGYPHGKADNYLLINFCEGLPVPGRVARVPESGDATLIYEGPHFMTFPAYGFEGLGPEDRREIRRRAYEVRAYEIRSEREVTR